MTNFIQTDQVRSRCPEMASLKEAKCKIDKDCQNRPVSARMNGRWTGRCILPQEAYVLDKETNITKGQTGLCEYAGR